MKRLEINPKFIFLYPIIIIIVLYLIFQSRFIILGPRISIYTPKNNEIVLSSIVLVTGHAENIAYISLDDRPIFVDEKGNFNEKLVAQIGINTIIMKARDRFGRTTEKTLKIVYNN